MDNLVRISTFSTLDSATDAITILTDNDIKYDLRDANPQIPEMFLNSHVENAIELYVLREESEHALELLKIATYDPNKLSTEGYDGYLLGFSDDELLEVVVQVSAWSAYDQQMAELLLDDRGKGITEEEKQRRIEDYIKSEYSPQTASAATIVFGYLLSAAGGLIGFAIGIALFISKSKDPSGNKYYSYTKASRQAGLGMIIVGIASVLLTFGVLGLL